MKDKTMHRVRLLRGFVLIEMLMVVGLIGLMTAVAVISFSAMWGNLKFKSQAEELVNVFQMAQDAATTSDRRYEVVLSRNPNVQGYIFREYTETQIYYDKDIFDNVLLGKYDDSLIQLKYFNIDAMYLKNVEYDYYSEADLAENLDEVDVFHFIAGRSGWNCGGCIFLLDEDDRPWTIVVHRMGKPAELIKGQWDLDSLGMLPQYKENVPF
ncbi:MAG: hypothetical protein H8E62_00790 [Planctomycetes bacterium]|nr:hypothetical protein [Planctomycetota bacterium]